MNMEELAIQFLEEFYRLGRYAQSQTIGHSMKGEAFLLLYLLQKNEKCSPGELSRVMKISSARVAAALNNLERKEMIVRLTDDRDKRKVFVELTEEGKKQAKKCRQIPQGMVERLMEQLGEEDSRQMLRILRRINGIMPQMQCCISMEIEDKGDNHDFEI